MTIQCDIIPLEEAYDFNNKIINMFITKQPLINNILDTKDV